MPPVESTVTTAEPTDDLYPTLDRFIDRFDTLVKDPAHTAIIANFFALLPLSLDPVWDVPTSNQLGASLRFYRKQAGMKRSALARRVGVSRAFLHRLETQPSDWLHGRRGTDKPLFVSRDLMLRIGIALKLDTDRCDDLLVTAGYAPLWADVHLMQIRDAVRR